jgi:hypothetical protein
MSLYLVGQLIGTEKAKAYELVIEYDPQPPFKTGNFETADRQTIDLAKTIIAQGVKKDLSLMDKINNIRTLIKLKKT